MSKYSPEAISKFISLNLKHCPVTNAAVFNTLRILKRYNPGDSYHEAYLGHYQKRGLAFVDYYHLLWALGASFRLDNVMEIGCRTGISICQLLSAMTDPKAPQVYLFDIFNDGFVSKEIVKMNLKALNLPLENVHFVIGDSLKTVPEFNPGVKMDYILVDGCHERPAARKDLENVIRLLESGGLLFFDDIAQDGCALIDVWEDFKSAHPEEFFFHENLDGKGIGVGVKR